MALTKAQRATTSTFPPTAPTPALYAKQKGYTKYFQKGGVWYGNVKGIWKSFTTKEEARSANIAGKTLEPTIDIETLKREAPETLIEPKREQFATKEQYQTALQKFRTTGNWATSAPITKEEKRAELEKRIAETQSKIEELQAEAEEKRLEEEERATREEAEKYYGYELPTEGAVYKYPEERAELEAEAKRLETRAIEDYQYNLEAIGLEKQKLIQDYQDYLTDIETGKLRVGESHQKDLERQLEERRMWLEEQEFGMRRNVEVLQRGWIGRGGLFAGPRLTAVREYGEEEAMVKERYLGGWEYGKEAATTTYEEAMEDYLTKTKRGTQAYEMGLTDITRRTAGYEQLKGRTLEDIAQARLQDVRALQTKYEEAIYGRMGATQFADWRKKLYGY